jgi:prophage regulatory protein
MPKRTAPRQFIYMGEAVILTGLSRSTLLRLESEGDFPRRRRLSARSLPWRRSDIERWLATRPALKR